MRLLPLKPDLSDASFQKKICAEGFLKHESANEPFQYMMIRLSPNHQKLSLERNKDLCAV